MSLIARLKSMWRRHDERLVEKGMEARAAGVNADALSVGPGVGYVESGALPFGLEPNRPGSPDEAAEHEEPQ
jgi:hypothetical protein